VTYQVVTNKLLDSGQERQKRKGRAAEESQGTRHEKKGVSYVIIMYISYKLSTILYKRHPAPILAALLPHSENSTKTALPFPHSPSRPSLKAFTCATSRGPR
jgi:hypothetical protein